MNTIEARAAFVNSQVACAMIELEAMKALNSERAMRGENIAYDEAAFLALQDKYGLGHNTVIQYLRDFS